MAIVSHTATDAGYVLVMLRGYFLCDGSSSSCGYCCGFCGREWGFSANFIPSGIDPLLQSFTQSAAQIINPDMAINPLNNWFFTSASSLFIILLGWYITDKIIEPRLQNTPLDGDTEDLPAFDEARSDEKRAFYIASTVMVAGLALLWFVSSTGLNSAARCIADYSFTFDAVYRALNFPLF